MNGQFQNPVRLILGRPNVKFLFIYLLIGRSFKILQTARALIKSQIFEKIRPEIILNYA